MKASFFEPVRYVTLRKMPSEWPLPPGFYDPDLGAQAFRSVFERLALVEELGFDWVSFSEHHYSARILCPSPIVMASHMAAHLHKITIAVLGPIIPLSNPVRVAEELAMLDTLTQGRLVVGLLRGTTNEYLVYSVKPEETRERTTEGMELILKAWTSRIHSAGKAAISSTGRSRSGRARCSSRTLPPMPWGQAASPVNSRRAITSASACPLDHSRW